MLFRSKDDFNIQAKKLVSMFVENFKKFENDVDSEIIKSGPIL